MTDTRKAFGEWLRTVASNKKITQDSFSLLIGISDQAQVSRLLAGFRELKIGEAIRISQEFNIPIEEICRRYVGAWEE